MNDQSLTPDSAELMILEELIKRGGMIAIPLSPYPNVMMQLAHERLIKGEQIRLADLAMVPGQHRQPEPARIIMVTPEGRKRRMELLVNAK